jgi:hypothetical protein
MIGVTAAAFLMMLVGLFSITAPTAPQILHKFSII